MNKPFTSLLPDRFCKSCWFFAAIHRSATASFGCKDRIRFEMEVIFFESLLGVCFCTPLLRKDGQIMMSLYPALAIRKFEGKADDPRALRNYGLARVR